ncbi:hypothetical protein K1719_031601 [Acacia pycnantha]|nr:hypothetical protein K1719_031601 [Acacia pycnantha]
MVATVAFGMGIDKPDIRQVIHYGCPKSLESYYRESGRYGRDGIASVCCLYYTRSDFTKGKFYCGELQTAKQRKAVIESLMAAEHYCLLTTCRRKFLLEYFGENVSSDRCVKLREDLSNAASDLSSLFAKTRFGCQQS